MEIIGLWRELCLFISNFQNLELYVREVLQGARKTYQWKGKSRFINLSTSCTLVKLVIAPEMSFESSHKQSVFIMY